MFVHPRCDGKNVGVKNDIFWGEVSFFCKQAIGPLADSDSVFDVCGLAFLVECHDDYSCSIASNDAGVFEERLLTLFHTDGVDDTLTLDALQSSFEHLPARGIDHDRNAGYVWFA